VREVDISVKPVKLMICLFIIQESHTEKQIPGKRFLDSNNPKNGSVFSDFFLKFPYFCFIFTSLN